MHKKERKRNKPTEQAKRAKQENVPGSDDGGDEELGTVRVTPGVGHGQETGPGVFQIEIFISELGAVKVEGKGGEREGYVKGK